jgi:hypothetical protein
VIPWPRLAAAAIASLALLAANADADRRRHHRPPPASEVLDGVLWQGPRLPPGDYSSRWDVIVFTAGEWQPAPDRFPNVEAVYARLTDEPRPRPRAMRQALEAAERVAEAVRAGRRVLVTCGQGYNRSGLVTGLAMRMLGYDADDIVLILRERRGVHALRNRAFLRAVRSYPD